MIRPFGESAVLVEVSSAAAAQHLASMLRESPPRGVTAAVPGLASVLVELEQSRRQEVTAELERLGTDVPDEPLDGRSITVPVAYGGRDGPDLAEVAVLCGLTEEEVVGLHVASELRVLFLGFAPGFAYLGGLPARLHVPRLATPRTVTPAGSVAVAGSMTGVYPADLPGGWRVIGRTRLALFDPHAEPPSLLLPGDRVRFEPT